MYRIIDLYKSLGENESLLPTGTNFDFWEAVYETNTSVMDREFARRFSGFRYFDFLADSDTDQAQSITDLKADVLSILTFNKKRYEEMYRVFLIEDEDMPITYNYDMTETYGAQKVTSQYGATSETKGQQVNTIGQQTNSHNVAPFNATTAQLESSDVMSQQQNTEGSRTDTSLAHTDTVDTDSVTNTRKGNIGVQTGADIARVFTQYWTEHYKFIQLIFDDIAKQILMVE